MSDAPPDDPQGLGSDTRLPHNLRAGQVHGWALNLLSGGPRLCVFIYLYWASSL
ncbi:hypothetical protein E2C01_066069 [Portunus trituberculatus]|uniref:Uncharacterized protein n=1 Tax=Portunus trituberculatus TaxID=210409 RepID=A0A5B7HH92_PORTR|nr:hypothetical protein [Portunus trituberculatus]